MRMTPSFYFDNLADEDIKKTYDGLSNLGKSKISIWDIICIDKKIENLYLKLFSFYFLEDVVQDKNCFKIIKKSITSDNAENDKAIGVIYEKNFNDIMCIIRKISYIKDGFNKAETKPKKYKSAHAKYIHEKLEAARLKDKKVENPKLAKDLSIENLISVVSNNHPSLTPITIYDLTIYQLYDSFERIRDRVAQNISDKAITMSMLFGGDNKKHNYNAWFENKFDT